MSFCYAIFLDIPYFRSYDLIAKPNGTYITAVHVYATNLTTLVFLCDCFNSLTVVVADRRQIITLPPKKQLGADKQTSCDKQLAADKQQGVEKQLL